MNDIPPLIVLVGPTAVGKTGLAIQLAETFSCEIISVDSMQVYRYMDIGTAKPTPAERKDIPHHLLDVADPDEDYNVARFVEDATAAIAAIRERGRWPLLVGGTGLYLKGLLNGLFVQQPPAKAPDASRIRNHLKARLKEEGRLHLYQELCRCDPLSAARIHPNDSRRLLRALEIFQSTGIPWSSHLEKQRQRTTTGKQRQNTLKLGLTCDRKELYQRIDQRVDDMVRQGFRNEVRELLDRGFHGNLKSMQSIGYRHMVNFLEGNWTWEQTLMLLARDTRRYAKRQYTWFNRDQEITWFHSAQAAEMSARVAKHLESLSNA